MEQRAAELKDVRNTERDLHDKYKVCERSVCVCVVVVVGG